MRSALPGQARAQYFDRNPLVVVSVGSNALSAAPHGNTVRSTYTVPANRKALVLNVHAEMRIATVAATPLQRQNSISVNGAPILSELMWSNTANDNIQQRGDPQSLLLAAGTVTSQDSDGSTGGTMDFTSNAYIIEFDA